MKAPLPRSEGMNRTTAFSVLILSICAAVLALPSFAQACSCVGPASGQEADAFYAQRIKDSDGAVIAKVKKVRYKGESTPGSFGDDEAIFTIRVRRAYKRFQTFPEGRKLRVHTAANGAACGLELGKGSVAGLFLDRYKGEWNGNLCGQISPKVMRRAAAYLDGGKPIPQMTSAACAGPAPAAI